MLQGGPGYYMAVKNKPLPKPKAGSKGGKKQGKRASKLEEDEELDDLEPESDGGVSDEGLSELVGVPALSGGFLLFLYLFIQ